MRANPLAAAVAGGLLAGALSACQSGPGEVAAELPPARAADAPPPADPVSPGHPHLPTLLRWPEPERVPGRLYVYPQAGVAGRLGVNAHGCFTVDRHLLIAPPGSRAVAPDATEIPGAGRIRRGERIDAHMNHPFSGGYDTRTWNELAPERRACLTRTGKAVEVAALNPADVT